MQDVTPTRRAGLRGWTVAILAALLAPWAAIAGPGGPDAKRAAGAPGDPSVTPASDAKPNAKPGPVDPALLEAREAAWRAWFAGDVAKLRELLPPDFIGIAWSDGPFSDLAETLASSKAFAASGGKLTRLAFPETRAQRYGDTVILYGRFEAVIEAGGHTQTVRGRLTETFVRRGGAWLHPGWHLDKIVEAAPSHPPPAHAR